MTGSKGAIDTKTLGREERLLAPPALGSPHTRGAYALNAKVV